MTPTALLLATTTRAAWLLDTGTGDAAMIDEGRGVYYGISFSETMIYIACRQADVGGDRDSQDNVILCFDRSLQPRGVLRPAVPVRDVHQICYHDGTLFVCSTYDDAVICHDLATGTWTAWSPFGEARGQDRHHINSIAASASGILLAGNRPSGWFASFSRDRLADAGGRRPLGLGTHNVWLQDGVPMVCSSDEGALRAVDGSMQPVMSRGWVRGFARDGETSYVGVSQNLVRPVRERSDCMVVRRDRAGLIDRTFSFEGFGMLHDLRLVGRPDATHNGVTLALSGLPPGAPRYKAGPVAIALDATRS